MYNWKFVNTDQKYHLHKDTQKNNNTKSCQYYVHISIREQKH